MRVRATRPRRPAHIVDQGGTDRGNIIVAVTIMMVIFMLASLLFVRVIGNEEIVLNRQNTFAGVASADAGVADALFRIDQGPSDWGSQFSTDLDFYVAGGSTGCPAGSTQCVASSIPAAPGVSYVATADQANPSVWTIRATGMVHGVPGAVEVQAKRSVLYPWALFGQGGLDFSGNTQGGANNPFNNYQPGPNSASDLTVCPNTPESPPCASIGSDGSIICSGGGPGGSIPQSVDSFYYPGGATGSNTDNCGSPSQGANPYVVITPQAPYATPNCPNDGQLGSANGFPVLQTGTWYCNTPISINGSLTIAGSADDDSAPGSDEDLCTPEGASEDTDGDIACLYVILDPSQYNQSTNAVNITPGSQVNTTISSDPPPANATLPDATRFQLFSNSSGSFGGSAGQPYYFSGVMDAPNATLTADGCKSAYYGSTIINIFNCKGGPHLAFYYDRQLGTAYGTWVTSGYGQIAPASVTLPSN